MMDDYCKKKLDIAVSIARQHIGMGGLDFHTACELAEQENLSGSFDKSDIARKIIGDAPMTHNEAATALADRACVSVTVEEWATYFVCTNGNVYEQRWCDGLDTWSRVFPPVVKERRQ
jgi:hypothetical protein